MSGRDNVDIDDIGGTGAAGNRSDIVSVVIAEGHDVAAPEDRGWGG